MQAQPQAQPLTPRGIAADIIQAAHVASQQRLKERLAELLHSPLLLREHFAPHVSCAQQGNAQVFEQVFARLLIIREAHGGVDGLARCGAGHHVVIVATAGRNFQVKIKVLHFSISSSGSIPRFNQAAHALGIVYGKAEKVKWFCYRMPRSFCSPDLRGAVVAG